MFISLKYKDTDFPQGLSLDNKISVFEDRVIGWQLDIAKKCAALDHSGFAVLHIIMSYFEAIAKYKDGFVQYEKSKKYLKQGLLDVLPSLKNIKSHVQEQIAEKFYEGVRCGLYHGGMTPRGIFISGEINEPLELIDNCLHIHPNKLLDQVCSHFDEYIRQLNNSQNSNLRRNFEKRFDMK